MKNLSSHFKIYLNLNDQKNFTLKRLLLLSLLIIQFVYRSFGQINCDYIYFSQDTVTYGQAISFKEVDYKACAKCDVQYEKNHYEWQFPGGNPFRALGPGPHYVTYSDTIGKYKMQLTVKYIDSTNIENECIQVYTKTINVVPNKDLVLKGFYSEPSNNSLALKWETVHEKDNVHFIIEKSTDNVTFSEISLVQSVGNHSKVIDYAVLDNNPENGMNYYRLKHTNKNGNVAYLESIAVDWTEIHEILAKYGKKSILVVLKDNSGNEVFTKIIAKSYQDDAIVAEDLDRNITSGNYVIVGSSINELYSKQLIIK